MPTTFGYVVGRPTALQEIVSDATEEIVEEETTTEGNSNILGDAPES